MSSHHISPLSKDRLFNWLITLSNQLSKGSIIVNIHDENLAILYANDYFVNLTNYESEQLIGCNLSTFIGERTNIEVAKELNIHIQLGIAGKFTLLHYTKHGSAFWNTITIHPIKDDEQQVQYVLLTCEDSTEAELNKMVYKLEHEVFAAIDQDVESLQTILSLISEKIEAFYIYDVFSTIHIFDESFQLKSFGCHTLPAEVVAQLEFLTITPNISCSTQAIYLKDFSTKEPIIHHNNCYPIKGSWTKPILSSQNKVIGIVTLFHQSELELKQSDINYLNRLALLIQLAVKYAEQKMKLHQLAFYDAETNLPNIHQFKSNLAQRIEAGQSGFVAVFYPAEINNIGDLYGRKASGDLLRELAYRIQNEFSSPNDFIARFSNAIMIGSSESVSILFTKQNLIESISARPFIIDGEENLITLKIGYTLFSPSMTVEECIHQSDIALTQARKINGPVISMYEENSVVELTEEMNILNQLAYGIQNDEFEVYLQPKINIETIEIEGFEALSRWNSKKLGFMSPVKYIPLAEQTGKIKDLDLLNLKKVLTWLQNRIDYGKKVLPVAVNISPKHFFDSCFLNKILGVCQQFFVPSQYIKLEVTESIELVDFEKAKDILVQLKSYGIECSIDDFGVGFSSLSYLPKLPFSEIKIDRSFINSMNEPGMYAIVQTIIQLANNINMRPIAEGIETEEQLKTLQQLGCPAGQGYYFYKPMPLIDAEKLIDLMN